MQKPKKTQKLNCLPNPIETIKKKRNFFSSPYLGHNWLGGRPKWKVVTLSSVFLNPFLLNARFVKGECCKYEFVESKVVDSKLIESKNHSTQASSSHIPV